MSYNVLITADIHVHDYIQHNIEPEFRLKQFVTLGQWFTDVIVGHECKAVIIAGDFFNVPSPRPKVVEVGANFLAYVSSYAPIFAIHGQHDIDVRKKSETFDHNTLLQTIQKIGKKIYYIHKDTVSLGGKTIYFHGYDNEYPNCDKCDIYVTHAFMKGAIMPGTNSPITHGVALNSKPLVIAGDIHQAQSYDNVLIPGPPIQHSFKDAPNTSVVILDLETLSNYRVPSGYVKEKQCYQFMTFTYKEELPEKTTELEEKLDIVKLLPQKKEADVIELKNDIVSELNPITILDQNLTDDLKDIHIASLSEVSSKTFPSLKFTLKKLNLKNFIGFKDLCVDFKDFGKLSLIIGENGSGKTSFFTALIFALKGGNGSDYSLEGEPLETIITLDYEGNTYEITRSWNKTKKKESENKLIFNINSGEDEDFAGIVAGNLLLIKHLPFLEYIDLLYMDQFRSGFLSTYTLPNKINLLNKICNIDIIDLLKKNVEEKQKIVNDDLKALQSTLQSQNDLKTEAVSILTKDDESEDDESEKVESREQLELARTFIEGRRNEYQLKRLDLQRKADAKKYLEDQTTQQINQCIQDIKVLELELKKIEESLCPTCQQQLPVGIRLTLSNAKKDAINVLNQNLINAMSSLNKMKQDVISKDDIDSCIKETQELDQKLNRLITKISKVEAREQKEESRKKAQETLKLIDDKILKLINQVKEKTDLLDKYLKYRNLVVPGGPVMNLLLTDLAERFSDELIKVKVYKELKSKEKRPDFTLEMWSESQKRWISYDKLSGGQRVVADTWWLSKLYDLIAGVGFILLDETFKCLDKENLEHCVEITKGMNYLNCFIISHEELFPDYDTLLKFENSHLEIL